MKYCRHCGAEVEEEDKYCKYCGGKFELDNSQEYTFAKQDFIKEPLADSSFIGDFSKNKDEPESYLKRYDVETASLNPEDGERSAGSKQLLFNKDAKTAQTLGILAFVFGIIGSPYAIIFGIISLIKTKKALRLCDTGKYDGEDKASNGRMFSIIGIVLMPVMVALVIFIFAT